MPLFLLRFRLRRSEFIDIEVLRPPAKAAVKQVFLRPPPPISLSAMGIGRLLFIAPSIRIPWNRNHMRVPLQAAVHRSLHR